MLSALKNNGKRAREGERRLASRHPPRASIFPFPSLAPYDTKMVHYGQNGELQCFKTHWSPSFYRYIVRLPSNSRCNEDVCKILWSYRYRGILRLNRTHFSLKSSKTSSTVTHGHFRLKAQTFDFNRWSSLHRYSNELTRHFIACCLLNWTMIKHWNFDSVRTKHWPLRLSN